MNTTIDSYVLQQASCRASVLVDTAGFRPDDWEDLRQDIVLDLLRRAPKFDPARGDWQGFVRGVARHQSTVLIARRRRTREVLGEDLVNREDTDIGDPMDTLDNRCCSDAALELHLRLDVHRVVASLPARLRSVALLLGQMPVKEVCERTGKSRSSVYQMIRQIREAFVSAGLTPSRELRGGRKAYRAGRPLVTDTLHVSCRPMDQAGKDDAPAQGDQPNA
jgi:RNA polymerase sigma-70 factor (ECF subfamily)